VLATIEIRVAMGGVALTLLLPLATAALSMVLLLGGVHSESNCASWRRAPAGGLTAWRLGRTAKTAVYWPQ
jgi:hypothetical protein